MNLQRIAATVAITGAVFAGASAITFGAVAFGADLPEPPSLPVAAPTTEARVTPPSVSPSATAPARSGAAGSVPIVDPMSDEYNPYITPGDADYVEMEERAEHLGRETVIAECMAGEGFEYLVAAWWLGEQSQPRGLDYETSILWLDAYYGEMRQDWSITDWQRQGCLGVGVHAAEVARAAGTPLTAPVPEPDPDALTPREIQTEFQRAIQTCMNERGYEYRIRALGEYGTSLEDDPSMPDGLTEEQRADWLFALWGDAGGGSAYRWEDAGCSGYATHVTGQDNMH
jgi:hypothetical protein